MADETEEIRRAFKKMFEAKIPLNCGCFKVKSIEATTCTILIDEEEALEVDGILLGFDKSGFIAYPKPGTYVWVIFNEGVQTSGAVVMVEETANADIMGNEFGGLVKVESLVNKVNAIENKVNSLAAKYNTHTHAVSVVTACATGTGSGSGTSATTSAPETGTLQNTTKSDIENEKVKHGKG